MSFVLKLIFKQPIEICFLSKLADNSLTKNPQNNSGAFFEGGLKLGGLKWNCAPSCSRTLGPRDPMPKQLDLCSVSKAMSYLLDGWLVVRFSIYPYIFGIIIPWNNHPSWRTHIFQGNFEKPPSRWCIAPMKIVNSGMVHPSAKAHDEIRQLDGCLAESSCKGWENRCQQASEWF